SQSYQMIVQPNGKTLMIPWGQPYANILVNWDIPANLNMLPDNAVSQQTIDSLASEAKKICKIVQNEATKQGIGPVKVDIGIRDLVTGIELDYGISGNQEYPRGTDDCEHIMGDYVGKSIGLNPSGRTPDLCPSLYVPN